MIYTEEEALEKAADVLGTDKDLVATKLIAAALLEARADALEWVWTLENGADIYNEEEVRLRKQAAELRGEP